MIFFPDIVTDTAHKLESQHWNEWSKQFAKERIQKNHDLNNWQVTCKGIFVLDRNTNWWHNEINIFYSKDIYFKIDKNKFFDDMI